MAAVIKVPMATDRGNRLLGLLVQAQRKQLGWSQERLVDEINQSTNYFTNKTKIARIERPVFGSKPDYELLLALALIKFLPYSADELWLIAANEIQPDFNDYGIDPNELGSQWN